LTTQIVLLLGRVALQVAQAVLKARNTEAAAKRAGRPEPPLRPATDPVGLAQHRAQAAKSRLWISRTEMSGHVAVYSSANVCSSCGEARENHTQLD